MTLGWLQSTGSYFRRRHQATAVAIGQAQITAVHLGDASQVPS